jgi:rare lipoprotein A (peptidoglycan hydrolase)
MKAIALAVLMVASWERFSDTGKTAASGHPFNPKSFSCATWLWPAGTKLHVVDQHNHLSVDVTVTDHPARRFTNRIDLSPAAFEQLNGLAKGVCDVTVTPIQK